MNTRNSGRFQSGYYRNLTKTVFVNLPLSSSHCRLPKRIKEETNCFQTLQKDLGNILNVSLKDISVHFVQYYKTNLC